MANKYDEIVRYLGGEVAPPALHTVLSEEELSTIETNLGRRLPSDYREFLCDYDGISFLKAFVLFPVKSNLDSFHTGHLDGFLSMWSGESNGTQYYHRLVEKGRTTELRWFQGIRLVREVDTIDEEEGVVWPAELLPIGESPSGSRIALAIGGLRPGAVFYWIIGDYYGQNVYLVADSFDEFMRSLYREEMF